jgi:hypothetical protein
MTKRTVVLFLLLAVVAGIFFFKPRIERQVRDYQRAREQYKQLEKVQLGCSRDTLRRLLGSPERVEVYSLGAGGGTVEFLFYAGAGERNPIAIESARGVVISWGERFYRETVPPK